MILLKHNQQKYISHTYKTNQNHIQTNKEKTTTSDIPKTALLYTATRISSFRASPLYRESSSSRSLCLRLDRNHDLSLPAWLSFPKVFLKQRVNESTTQKVKPTPWLPGMLMLHAILHRLLHCREEPLLSSAPRKPRDVGAGEIRSDVDGAMLDLLWTSTHITTPTCWPLRATEQHSTVIIAP